MSEHAMRSIVERSIGRECILRASFVLDDFGESSLVMIFFLILLENFTERGGHMWWAGDGVWIWIYYSCLSRICLGEESHDDIFTLPFLSDYSTKYQ